MKDCKKFYGLIAIIIIIVSMLNITSYASNESTNETLTYTSLVGKNRYDTSILVSKVAYPSGAKNVILVNGTSSVDGIIVGGLAHKLSAPVLITPKEKLNENIKAEIERLNPQKVYLIGGSATLSNTIKNELTAMDILTERIYGSTRYTTATAIATKIGSFDKVIICNSKDNGVNVSAVAAIAARKGIPILYNDSNSSLNSSTYNYVKSRVKTIYMVGNGMSKSQETNLKNKGISIIKINGNTPYDINAEMLKKFNTKCNSIVLVNNSIDAMSVSYLAAKTNSLLLYTGTNLTNSQKNIVRDNEISRIYYAGGGKIKGPVKDAILALKNRNSIADDTELQLELNKSKVVFYIPHQDDESSYFSQTILKAIKEKGAENVYIVMISDGANSAVNISKTNKHYAEVKSLLKKYGITFTQARDNEFMAACKALGFKEENIYFNEDINKLGRLKDGGVKADDVKSTMLYFEKKFKGDVTHITYSFEFETHNDHQQSGEALNELYYDLSIPEETFMSVYFVVRGNYQFKEGDTDNIKMFTLDEINYGNRIINALNMYKEMYDSPDKTKVRIGIGYRSAGKVIDTVIQNVRNETITTNIHLPF